MFTGTTISKMVPILCCVLGKTQLQNNPHADIFNPANPIQVLDIAQKSRAKDTRTNFGEEFFIAIQQFRAEFAVNYALALGVWSKTSV